LLNTCGLIKRIVKDCGPPPELCTGRLADEEAEAQSRGRKITWLQVLTGTLNISAIEKVRLNCTPDIFMEILLNNLKNDTISHQSFIRLAKQKKISELKKDLAYFKKNFLANSERIKEIETELNTILDLEMRSELESFRHYDIIHNEKITPKFLSLSRI
jgi:hypothetical protein